MPGLLIQIAFIILIVRSIYVVVQHLNKSRKNWLDILFHASIAVVSLGFLF